MSIVGDGQGNLLLTWGVKGRLGSVALTGSGVEFDRAWKGALLRVVDGAKSTRRERPSGRALRSTLGGRILMFRADIEPNKMPRSR